MKRIPLSELENDPQRTLENCCDSGETIVVELPDHRLVAIQTLEPDDDDNIVDELIQTNPEFRAMLERSNGSPRRPFPDAK